MKIVAFSDTHFKSVPPIYENDIDFLIFAGDWSGMSYELETLSFANWFKSQTAKHKILVPGNHDYFVNSIEGAWVNKYEEVGGYKILASPYTPEFCDWNYMKSEEELDKMYDCFPVDVDILITHGPCYGIGDLWQGKHIGSKALLEYVERVKPLIHIFGHIHGAFGQYAKYRDKLFTIDNPNFVIDKATKGSHTYFYNVSMCNEAYRLVNRYTIINVGD